MMNTRRSPLRTARAGQAPLLLLAGPLTLALGGTPILGGACVSSVTAGTDAGDGGGDVGAGSDVNVLLDFDASDGGATDATVDAFGGSDADLNDASDAPGFDANACQLLACPGTCVVGRCLFELTNGGAYDLTVRSSTVYWTNSGTTPGSGSVLSIPSSPSGSAGARTLASGQNYPLGIAASATSVYWANGSASAGQVLAESLTVTDGGFVDAGPRDASAADGGDATIAGGPLTIASGQASPVGVAVDATNVYWTTAGQMSLANGTVMKAPLGGGQAVTLASGRNGSATLVVDATSVYWIDRGLGVFGGLVLKVPITGGATTTLAQGQNSPSSIAVTATDVYWTQLGTGMNDSAVVKTSLASGTITTIAGNQGILAGLAVDAENVYWAVGGGNGSGGIFKAPLSGNVVTPVVSGLDSPFDLALDDTSLYWTDNTDGTITKATPK
jgi:hypothetical protein